MRMQRSLGMAGVVLAIGVLALGVASVAADARQQSTVDSHRPRSARKRLCKITARTS